MLTSLPRQVKNHSLNPNLMEIEGGFLLFLASGGADSTALLHLFARFFSGHFRGMRVIHFQHGLRGEESRKDAEFVAGLCRDLGLECEIVPAFVRKEANLQERARNLRREHVGRLLREIPDSWAVLGHQLEDSVENFWITLTQGRLDSRMEALPVLDSRQRIFRPFRPVYRQEIRQWLLREGFSFREDSSNLSDEYLRNRIRHQNADWMLGGFIDSLQEDFVLLHQKLSKELWRKWGEPEEGLGVLSCFLGHDPDEIYHLLCLRFTKTGFVVLDHHRLRFLAGLLSFGRVSSGQKYLLNPKTGMGIAVIKGAMHATKVQ